MEYVIQKPFIPSHKPDTEQHLRDRDKRNSFQTSKKTSSQITDSKYYYKTPHQASNLPTIILTATSQCFSNWKRKEYITHSGLFFVFCFTPTIVLVLCSAVPTNLWCCAVHFISYHNQHRTPSSIQASQQAKPSQPASKQTQIIQN